MIIMHFVSVEGGVLVVRIGDAHDAVRGFTYRGVDELLEALERLGVGREEVEGAETAALAAKTPRYMPDGGAVAMPAWAITPVIALCRLIATPQAAEVSVPHSTLVRNLLPSACGTFDTGILAACSDDYDEIVMVYRSWRPAAEVVRKLSAVPLRPLLDQLNALVSSGLPESDARATSWRMPEQIAKVVLRRYYAQTAEGSKVN
jgi:hypothetical protein